MALFTSVGIFIVPKRDIPVEMIESLATLLRTPIGDPLRSTHTHAFPVQDLTPKS
ncbi:MAG TPA: hypothetical protein VM008_21305 [Phycisphaerae bacterium]|nr:hypothetical protein [Phycisphaerae bacterium]